MQLSLAQVQETPAKINQKTNRDDIIHAAANELAKSHGYTHGPRPRDLVDAEIVCRVVFEYCVKTLFEGRQGGFS